MKKFTLLLLVLVIGCLSLTGIAMAQADGELPNPSDLPRYKIGVIIYGKEDNLGSMMYSNLNYAAKLLNVELLWELGDLDAESQITAAENLLTSGVDGILCLPLSEIATQKIATLCDDAGVYFAITFRQINDANIKKVVHSKAHYVGNSTGADAANAEELVRLMAEAGKKNVAFYFASPGTSNVFRNDGFRSGMEKYGVTQIAESTVPTDGSLAPITSTIQNFVLTNPNIDGIVSANSSGGIGETIISALAQLNVKDKVSIAVFDVFGGVKDAFESGYLTAACGGQTPQATYMFMLLYNAIDGNKLSEEPVELLQKFIFLTNSEDSDNFTKYVTNPEYQVFSEKDIYNMVVSMNPDFSMDSIQEMMDAYTLDAVVQAAELRN